MSETRTGGTTSGALRRVVGLWGAVGMGLGSILGTGVFVSLGIAAGVVGPGLVPAVALAALVATANGMSSAQLAAAHPVSGGTYEYGHRFVNPLAGFTAGWMFLAAKGASAATAALGCAGYLLHVAGLPDDATTRVLVAVGIVIALTAVVATGVRRSNLTNALIVGVTLAALGTFVVAGWASVDGSRLPERLGPSALVGSLADPASFLHATALLFVAYTGYGRIATLGEEVREPARVIPRAIVATLVLTMLLYVSVAATAVAVVGADAFAEATAQDAAPLEVVARSFDAGWVAPFVAVGAVTAMAGVLLNLILGLSRVLLAMARRAEMPTALGKVDARSANPTRAVLVIGALVAGLALLGDVRTTWAFSAFTVLVYYGLTNLAALRLPTAARRFPRWIAVAGLASCFGLAFFVPPGVWMAGLGLLVLGWIGRSVAGRFATPRAR